MLRVCAKCGISKPDTEFYSVTQRGITRLRRICKGCSKAQLRDHTHDVKPTGRICTVCKQYKPLTAFHSHKICMYGVEPICKLCKAQKRRERDAMYPDRAKNVDLKAKYGITIEQYHAMRERQQGACAICGASDARLVVDHHHGTGQVRALLCHLCNALIGCAREDPAILSRAIAYLAVYQDTVAK